MSVPTVGQTEDITLRKDALPMMSTIVVVGLAHWLRYGYRFGYSDQDEFLPWLLARLNPGILAGDWFVQGQQSGFNVRSGFVYLLELPAGVFGVEMAVLGVYVIAMAGLIAAVYLMVRSMGGAPLSGLLGALGAVVLIPRWTLGGNAAVSSMLVPSLVAWALGAWMIVFLLRNRPVMAGLFVGAAAWIQILVAAQLGAIGLVVVLLSGTRGRGRLAFGPALGFSLAALLPTLPVVLQLLAAGGGIPADSFAVLGGLRAPHHYDPSFWPLRDYLQVLLLAAAGGMAWRRCRHASMKSAGLLLLAGVAGPAMGLLGWILGSAQILSLQPFSTTVLAALISATLLACAISTPMLGRTTWRVVLAGSSLLWVLPLSGFQLAGRPAQDPGLGELTTVAIWAGSQTPSGSIFALPPTSSGFRHAAGRANVVNFKAYPFSRQGAAEWYERMTDWAPGVLPPADSVPGVGAAAWLAGAWKGQRRGVDLLAPLDSAYEALGSRDLLRLSRKYQVDYVVRRTPIPGADTLLIQESLPGTVLLYRVAREPENENRSP